jgi:small-conductance mechanosensitive channel
MVAVTLQVDWLTDQQVLLSVLLSAAVIVLAWELDTLLSRYTAISEETVADLRGFRGVAAASVVVLCLVWIGGQPTPSWLTLLVESTGIAWVLGWLGQFLPSFLVESRRAVLITTLGAWWAWKLRAKGDDILERVVAQRYDETVAPIVENVWDVTIVAVFILLVLDQWGISVAALLAPAGIIGIILGFSARETVANFFGSLALYADETYERGDYIELESGISGTVRDISVRSTVLQTLDGDLVNVPNSELNEAKITNKSNPTTNRRITSTVGVSYDADPERVKAVLSEAAEPVSEAKPPQVHLRSFGDSALVFEVLVWIERPVDKLTAEDRLNVAIYVALADAGIEIPYPQREVAVDSPEGV